MTRLAITPSRRVNDTINLDCAKQYSTVLHSTFTVHVPSRGKTMTTAKTTTLTFRIEPGLKEAVRTAADLEHRSIANMVEVMIRDYCGRVGVTIQDKQAENETKPKPRKD